MLYTYTLVARSARDRDPRGSRAPQALALTYSAQQQQQAEDLRRLYTHATRLRRSAGILSVCTRALLRFACFRSLAGMRDAPRDRNGDDREAMRRQRQRAFIQRRSHSPLEQRAV